MRPQSTARHGSSLRRHGEAPVRLPSPMHCTIQKGKGLRGCTGSRANERSRRGRRGRLTGAGINLEWRRMPWSPASKSGSVAAGNRGEGEGFRRGEGGLYSHGYGQGFKILNRCNLGAESSDVFPKGRTGVTSCDVIFLFLFFLLLNV